MMRGMSPALALMQTSSLEHFNFSSLGVLQRFRCVVLQLHPPLAFRRQQPLRER